MRTSAKQVAKRLKALGFKALSQSEPNFDEDGEVKITEFVHVQVGFDYVNVVRQEGEGDDLAFQFYPAAATYEALAEDLRTALTSASPGKPRP